MRQKSSGKKHSEQIGSGNSTISSSDTSTKPQFTLFFDEKLAAKLESEPLFQDILKECQSYLNDINVQMSGTHSAKVMEIIDIVERHRKSHPSIDKASWAGVIVHRLFPERYSCSRE